MASNYLYIFDNDLRTSYLPVLSQFIKEINDSGHGELQCAYLFDPEDLKPKNFQSALISPAKLKLICESLKELGQVLANKGILLDICIGNKNANLGNLIKKYNVTCLGYSSPTGSYESELYRNAEIEGLTVHNDFQTSLFDKATLPFAINDLPATFTRFRKAVEALPLDELFTHYQKLPELSHKTNCAMQLLAKFEESYLSLNQTPAISYALDTANKLKIEFSGGEGLAVHHMNNYFSLTSPSVYKTTRNFLDNWTASTKFSVALCLGNISPKQIWREIVKYELKNGSNESTYWIKFELLWREYFHWYAAKYNEKLFHFSGITQQKPLSSFYPERFRKWIDGATPSHFINAIMNQLKATGYISNRARQLTASYFVNELNIDWRYGAAYFQSQLIDHDVASNWGNWQYLAGVGCDPRGKRKFNIEKQQNLYDPNMSYINKWISSATTLPLDSVDYVDWPIVNEEP